MSNDKAFSVIEQWLKMANHTDVAALNLEIERKSLETLKQLAETGKATYEAPYKDKSMEKYERNEELEKMTGWATMAERIAYDLGRSDEEKTFMKFISSWSGETNSAAGEAMHNAIKRLKNKEAEIKY